MFWEVMRKIHKKDPPATEKELIEAYQWQEWRVRMEAFWKKVCDMREGQEKSDMFDHHSRNNATMYSIEPNMWIVVTNGWTKSQRDRWRHVREEEVFDDADNPW